MLFGLNIEDIEYIGVFYFLGKVIFLWVVFFFILEGRRGWG